MYVTKTEYHLYKRKTELGTWEIIPRELTATAEMHAEGLFTNIYISQFSPQRFQRSGIKLSFQIYFSLFLFMHPIFYVTEMLTISKVYFFLNWPLAFAHAVGFYLKLHYYAH